MKGGRGSKGRGGDGKGWKGRGMEMEGPTYKRREGRGKGRGRVLPVITVPPGPRGARIVTVYMGSLSLVHSFYRATLCVSAVFAVVRCPPVCLSRLVDCIHMQCNF